MTSLPLSAKKRFSPSLRLFLYCAAIIHMITMHDEPMAAIMSKHELNTREEESLEEPGGPLFGNYLLMLLLLRALTRRHRRFYDIYGWRGNPMSEYLKESMAVEREHMAELIAMMQDIM